MKSLYTFFCFLTIITLLFVAGCDLLTKEPSTDKGVPPGDDLIMNEVFTLSPDKYYAFSWIELFNPTKNKIWWFNGTLPATVFTVGSGGTVLRTDDDGAHWQTLPNSVTAEIHAVSFPLPDTGYAVGEGGTIIKIRKDTLGNYNFTDLTSANPAQGVTLRDLFAAQFPGKVIVVVGDSGVIMRSVDRGATFANPQTTGTKKNLYGIAYNTTSIFVAGDGGTILKSLSYNKWTPLIPPPSQSTTNYHSVKFISEQMGWVMGEGGAIAFTSNGETWREQKSNTLADLRAGFFRGQTGAPWRDGIGWVVGDSGVILATKDYGTTWLQQSSPTSAMLNNVNFADSLRGWAFGDGGVIVSTTDGGSTWTQEQSHISSRILGSFMLPLDIVVENYYQLEMWGQKRHFFYDSATFTVNFDYITKTDTGLINFIVGINEDKPIPPNGFMIVNSDSGKFKDHINLGPGSVRVSNFPIGFEEVIIGGDDPYGQVIQPIKPILWRLLSSGEIRLVKKYVKLRFTGRIEFLGDDSRVIDCVRYGYFTPKLEYFPNEELYPDNIAVGYIPDWYSLARWENDRGGDIKTISTAKSWYFAERPIPGWYSQKRK